MGWLNIKKIKLNNNNNKVGLKHRLKYLSNKCMDNVPI